MKNAPMIRAIPTKYKGTEFRSRTEARWAVFFDEMGIAWQFEPEGYELTNGTRYLPDFWLPDMWGGGIFFEVKPQAEDGIGKAEQLAAMTGKAVAVSSGNAFDSAEVDILIPSHGESGELNIHWDQFGFTRCSFCDRPTLSYNGSCPRHEARKCQRGTLADGHSPEQAHDIAMKCRFWNPGGAR